MKRLFALSAAILAASAFSATAAEKQVGAKAPMLMNDAQMAEVVGGKQAGAGFGICTATFKANAPGAIARFALTGLGEGTNLPGNGNGNGHANPPGFGLWTAQGVETECGGGQPPPPPLG